MNEWQVTVELVLTGKSLIELEKSLSFDPENERIKNVHFLQHGENIHIIYKVLSESVDEARNIINSYTESVVNRITFFKNIIVKSSDIINISRKEQKDGKTVYVETLECTVRVIDDFQIKIGLGEKSLAELKDFLLKDVSEEGFEALVMYREVLSERNIALRYILFYRLMENILGRNDLEKWIRSKMPTVETRPGQKGNATIFTYLRDCIHPKTTVFPYADIEKYIYQLQDLLKQLIQETL